MDELGYSGRSEEQIYIIRGIHTLGGRSDHHSEVVSQQNDERTDLSETSIRWTSPEPSIYS